MLQAAAEAGGCSPGRGLTMKIVPGRRRLLSRGGPGTGRQFPTGRGRLCGTRRDGWAGGGRRLRATGPLPRHRGVAAAEAAALLGLPGPGPPAGRRVGRGRSARGAGNLERCPSVGLQPAGRCAASGSARTAPHCGRRAEGAGLADSPGGGGGDSRGGREGPLLTRLRHSAQRLLPRSASCPARPLWIPEGATSSRRWWWPATR